MTNPVIENHKEMYYQQNNKEIFEKLKKETQQSQYLPKFHIFPESGLMNDPNGLAYFNSQYHVFFQWYPFAPVHGLKHWGYTKSDDLVHWTKQEFALIPDQEYEKNGCYSGNAIEFEEELYLFYTANYKTENGKIPKQAVAVMDKDEQVIKYSKPIISEKINGLSGELRDPFVFERAGIYYMLLGGSRFQGKSHAGFGDKGVLVVYKSKDLFHWEYLDTMDLPIDTGYMLECPSLIQIDGKDVLFVSVMGMKTGSYQFSNRFATLYLIGNLDIEGMCFQIENWDEMDAGFDFYAAQAFLGESNVPLLFAWFGCGEPEYPIEENWKHGLTFPQRISLENGNLKRYPVDNIVEQFSKEQAIDTTFFKVNSSSYHLHLDQVTSFKVGYGHDYWEFIYDKNTSKVTVSRENLQQKIDVDYGFERSAFVNMLNSVDLFVDNSFVEIYLNKGEKVFSFQVFQEKADNIWSSKGLLAGTLYY
ncbi:invertase [Tetragenococcus halophilus subsp. flandriensis]|uniref:glycoside hydrolase family 32 protein n=1 Tax=Tetragenococcus halophilus TaxID=51669 RepID=UPI0023E98AF2|nr:glycoside hydrolase family 32 protein [Tetragenococcus halophilus]GMA09405.1 invertase [Tetragenococcus halophilus subsp. flandriensis]